MTHIHAVYGPNGSGMAATIKANAFMGNTYNVFCWARGKCVAVFTFNRPSHAMECARGFVGA